MSEKKYHLPEFGLEVTIGKFANQADGAAWLTKGGTVVLATACSAKSKDFPGFLPLTVDYREQFAAAGKIPGGYFKREGKFSDKEVLTGRLIDRSIRPLFPENFFDQVQILATVYSVDRENAPYTLSLLASSIALTISKIPFLEPVGAVEVIKVDDQWIVSPTFTQSISSKSKIVFAGTLDGICMVEGTANEISEKEFIDAMFMAHDVIKKQIEWQNSIAKDLGTIKQEIVDPIDWKNWFAKAKSVLTPDAVTSVFVPTKAERVEAIKKIKDIFIEKYKEEFSLLDISESYLDYVFDYVLQDALTERIFETGKRIDNRDFDTVRKISTEVGLLPYNHGSALFRRGGTQALVSVTLGGTQDELRVEDIMSDELDKTFILHYNFPPFSVGEVRPSRGPGRREVGHGYLASTAISQVLPSKEDFPYTIRIVSDILESDGSTSMATVCGSTMALMQAGVGIRKMVSGVAMGLLMDDAKDFRVLTDISGIEDAFGMMDFKVAGTDDGITAIQMDIKHKGGLTRKVFETALDKAKNGRKHILTEMKKVMSEPNKQLSDLVPKITTFKVNTDRIGAIIGKGGENIKKIIELTGTSIDIGEDGTVKVYGHPSEKTEQAIAWVKLIGGTVEKGSMVKGKIKRLVDFGIFIEIAPGVDGLAHISTIPRAKQQNLAENYRIDSPVTVQIVDYDSSTGKIRLKIVE